MGNPRYSVVGYIVLSLAVRQQVMHVVSNYLKVYY